MDDDQSPLIPGVGNLLSACADEMREDGQSSRGTLYLNAKSSLITELAGQARAGKLNETACQLLYQAVRLFSDRQMNAKQCMEAWTTLTESLERMIQ
jgi:HSP90 family molecular chaperone